jgi:C4-type Zn-finger protein
MATCPHCQQKFNHLTLETMTGSVPFSTSQWNCLVFKCPHCDFAISADIDMTAVRSDIIDTIKARR